MQLRPGGDTGTESALAAEIDQMRRLPCTFEELTEDMGAFAALAKGYSLGQEFMEYVMQHRAGGVDVVQHPEPE